MRATDRLPVVDPMHALEADMTPEQALWAHVLESSKHELRSFGYDLRRELPEGVTIDQVRSILSVRNANNSYRARARSIRSVLIFFFGPSDESRLEMICDHLGLELEAVVDQAVEIDSELGVTWRCRMIFEAFPFWTRELAGG